MSPAFDISQDELPIFLSEVDEHLQTLDEILIQLESLKNESNALQAIFRAAHTLKGMAGMINHTRMVRLTHALEAVLDRVRKGEQEITTSLIDTCLDAVDSLRRLREEVVSGEESDVDVESLLTRFDASLTTVPVATTTTGATAVRSNGKANGAKPRSPRAEEAPAQPAPTPLEALTGSSSGRVLIIHAAIDPHSIASAARAFQLMLALQDLGEILEMQPTQAQIETAAPANKFFARLSTAQPQQTVCRALEDISEVQDITVLEEESQPAAPVEGAAAGKAAETDLASSGLPGEEQEHLVATSESELEAAAETAADAGAEATPATSEQEDEPPTGVDVPQAAAPVVPAARKNSAARTEMTVRTSVERLDILMELVGELITDRNHLSQMRTRYQNGSSGAEADQFNETVAHLSRTTDQLQQEVMRIRMLPVSNVFHKFRRLVRDLASKTGKKIDLIIRGEDTELDRSVIEEINDPLIHLLRNAVDHGIETPEERLAAGKPERGTILLSARHEQGRIVLTVEDDGRGIDVSRLRASALTRGLISEEESRALPEDKALDLIFLSGVSTASSVTDISGRGVGMDIVRTNIQRINGNILIETNLGHGTTFEITLPLTLAIIATLLVRASATTFAIPIVMIAETLKLTGEDIRTIRGRPITLLRNHVLPLVYMSEVFNLPRAGQRASSYAVVVNFGKQQVGIVVDELVGEEEVVVKSLGSLIGDVPGISSATILGDGSISLIMDVAGFLKLSENAA